MLPIFSNSKRTLWKTTWFYNKRHKRTFLCKFIRQTLYIINRLQGVSGGVFETYTGTFRQVYWNGTNFLNKLPFVFKYISAFSHLAIHKEPFFWTLQKSNQYFVFKTTYLFSKVIVPKHRNRRWIRQRAFQDQPLQLCLSWISLCACFPTSDGLFCWCQYFPVQGRLSLAALSYRSCPSGWQREAQHGFRRGHVPCLVFSATKCHGQLVTTGSTTLARGSKGAQVSLFLLYETGTICNEGNSFTEDVCHGKRRWFFTPRFCWESDDIKRENLLPSFYPPGMVGSQDSRLLLCTRG